MSRIVLSLIAFFFLDSPGNSISAQSCSADSLVLSTGYDHTSNNNYPIGSADGYWQVVSDPDPNTAEPRPAYTIDQNPAWSKPLTGSEWISSYNSQATNLNGLYEFEYKFCIGDLDSLSMHLVIRADDSAQVFLPEIKPLGSQQAFFTIELTFPFIDPVKFNPIATPYTL